MPRFLFSLFLTMLFAAPAAAQDFKVIVNSANSTTELDRTVASKLFLRQSSKFPNGTAAQPVDHDKSSALRESFSKTVLGRSASAVATFWQQQIFSGKEMPPPVKPSDAEVIAYIKATPGGIGYVSAGTPTDGVKVIDVK